MKKRIKVKVKNDVLNKKKFNIGDRVTYLNSCNITVLGTIIDSKYDNFTATFEYLVNVNEDNQAFSIWVYEEQLEKYIEFNTENLDKILNAVKHNLSEIIKQTKKLVKNFTLLDYGIKTLPQSDILSGYIKYKIQKDILFFFLC